MVTPEATSSRWRLRGHAGGYVLTLASLRRQAGSYVDILAASRHAGGYALAIRNVSAPGQSVEPPWTAQLVVDRNVPVSGL